MKKIVIVGGGFFGCYLALQLQTKGHSVTLLEAEDELMTRASCINQARVHGGYHYPRSILTALRSRYSFLRFYEDFSECIENEFDNYYMISKRQSHITSKQFEIFCERISAPYRIAKSGIKSLLNNSFIEDAFFTQEYCFDSKKIKKKLTGLLESSGVEVLTSSRYLGLKVNGANSLNLKYLADTNEHWIKNNHHIFNCTYSNINIINSSSNLPLVPLRHEVTEIVLVDVPDVLANIGITVMDGPFFSLMPFPAKNCHSLTHVRYTPHQRWSDEFEAPLTSPDRMLSLHPKKSAFNHIKKDISRYISSLDDLEYKESLWEIKTILPNSDYNDSRPILFKMNHGASGFHCLMGAKIDNVYDVMKAIEQSQLI